MLNLPIARKYDAKYGTPMPRGISRIGLLVHFDGSSSDAGGINHLRTSTKGYTWAIDDQGKLIQLEPPALKTPHAGLCLTQYANSRYYGACILTNETTPATEAQYETLTMLARELWRHEFWGAVNAENSVVRVRGHDEEAIYPPGHPKAGQLGRKCDPTGLPGGKLILSMPRLRAMVLDELRRQAA